MNSVKSFVLLFAYVACIPLGIMGTALGLVQLPMQLNKDIRTLKLGIWVDGNLMLSKNISGYLPWNPFFESLSTDFFMLLLAGVAQP